MRTGRGGWGMFDDVYAAVDWIFSVPSERRARGPRINYCPGFNGSDPCHRGLLEETGRGIVSGAYPEGLAFGNEEDMSLN